MKAICAKCGGNELRVHGSRTHIEFRRRWKWVGPVIPHITVRALEVSCANCAFAFVLRKEGATDAPLQSAYEALQQMHARMNGPEANKPKEGEAAPPPRNIARPAGDPRVKQRR